MSQVVYSIAALWLVCAFLNFGATLAYFQKEFPSIARQMFRKDVGVAVIFALMGPFWFLIVLCMSGFYKHGFMFSKPHDHPNERI